MLASDYADFSWSRTFLFFGDERHVPPTDAESNYRMASESLLSNVPIPEGDHIGHDIARDAIRYTVSEGGVTVVQKAKDTLLTRSRNF